MRAALMLLATVWVCGCATVEGGFKYEYDGKIFRADGKTPAKGVVVRLGRPNPPAAPDLPERLQKQTAKYVDKSPKVKTNHDGRYQGVLETVQGWKYSEAMGMHTSGPTKPPEPPTLPEVILYVEEKGGNWIGYRMTVPIEAQKDAISGIRKLHVPDLLLPAKAATKPASKDEDEN